MVCPEGETKGEMQCFITEESAMRIETLAKHGGLHWKADLQPLDSTDMNWIGVSVEIQGQERDTP